MGKKSTPTAVETNLGMLLPEGWDIKPLGTFAETATGGTPDRKQPDYFGKGYPWVKSGELEDNIITATEESITEAGLANSSAKLFSPNTLLMALYGATTGRLGILNIQAATNQAVCAIFPEPKVADVSYCHYALMYRRPALLQSRYGGAQPNISQTIVRNLLLPLPPLSEQKAIAEVLRTVQRAKEATEKVIAACRQLKQSLMRHLFTYGPVPFDQADKVELKETKIGPMPEHWEIVPFGQAISGTQYGLSQRGEPDGQYPVLRMNNLNDGRILADDLQYVSLDRMEFNKYRLNCGDVLFNRTNSFELVGKTSIFDLPGDYVFASYLVRATPLPDRLEPQFANFYMNVGSTQARLKLLATRAVSQSNINATKLRGFLIPLPPRREQRQIADMLVKIDDKIVRERSRHQVLTTLFNTLLHDLMTGRVRVV